MGLSPISVFDPAAYTAETSDTADATADESQDQSPMLETSSSVDLVGELRSGVQGIERSLMQFTSSLLRELGSLEQKFTSLFGSLLGSFGQAASATKSGSQAAPQAQAGDAPPSPYDGIIQRAASREGVDPKLIDAVIRQESGFRADAVSKAGAVGLMQLMPATARDLGVADPFDAQANVAGGTRLLRSLLDRYGGRLDLALAAYNAGPAAVDRYGGVPPYPETKAYVDDIMARYRSTALAQS